MVVKKDDIVSYGYNYAQLLLKKSHVTGIFEALKQESN